MTYLGSIVAGSTLSYLFTSRATSGVPTALVSTASASVYKDGGATQAVTLASLTTNFDSVAGLNLLVVDSSDSVAFFAADSEFAVVLDNGTVNGASVVGEVVASFSVNDGTLRADSITSSSFSSDALSAQSVGLVAATHPGVTIPTVTNVTNVSNATIAAGSNVTVGVIVANAITATAIASNAITAAKIAADSITSAKIGDDALGAEHFADAAFSTHSIGLVAATHPGVTIPAVTSVTNVSNATVAAGSNVTVGVIVANAITAAAFAADSITSAKIADNALGAEHFADNAFSTHSIGLVAATHPGVTIPTVTDVTNIGSQITVGFFTASAASELAKSVLTASLAGSGVPHATRNIASALRTLRNRVDVGASVATVYAENDSTSAWTASVTTGAFPVNSFDPA